METIMDISAVLSIPAFAVLIWQLQNVNARLTAADERYERLVTRFIEAIEAFDAAVKASAK